MSEVSMVRRRLASPFLPAPVPASALDDDDLLLEILLRLTPKPSSLLRASVVCKRWRRLVSDPSFLRRFRAHHRKPPLLGFISLEWYGSYGPVYCFTPTLDPPDRIPAPRFTLTPRPGESLALVDCRHGLALFLNKDLPEAIVWNPISDRQCRVALPRMFDSTVDIFAAVLCNAGDDDHGHVHGDCDLNSFKLVLVRRGKYHTDAIACLYKSKSTLWENVISTTITDRLISWGEPSVLVRNALCWMLNHGEGDVLQFDFDVQKLVVIEKPAYRRMGYSFSQITRTEEGSLGLIVLTQVMRLWVREVDVVGRWVLQKTIELPNHLSPRAPVEKIWGPLIQGYDEDNNVIFLRTSIGLLFMIQLDSMRFKEIFGANLITTYFPYTSYYASDWATGGRDDGAGMSSST